MKKERLLFGVGRNDSVRPVYRYSRFNGKLKLVWTCPAYGAWKHMLARCYSPKLHAKFPTYSRCTVVDEWLSLSEFRLWMMAQPWEGAQLDKDLLIPGNKVYGPDTCVFIPSQLNVFIADRVDAFGGSTVGAARSGASGKFRVRCCNPFSGVREHLGYFTDSAEANEAWRSRKHQLACAYADRQADPRVAAALRARYSPPITSDSLRMARQGRRHV